MILALSFVTPLLLIGALAAAIPFILHLLSSVSAQEMMFPTLRFLRRSMEKTARRRRLQHWLLLVLRAAMFALLAISVAEPISRATGGWLTGQSFAAAIVLDNGYSMAVSSPKGSRLERAKAEAAGLLSGDEKPALAAVLTANGGFISRQLTSGLDELRAAVARTRIGYGPVPLAERIQAAIEMLEKDHSSRKAIYVFSDLQRMTFEQVASLEAIARGRDIHLLAVDASAGEPSNVGIGDLDIAGRRVVDSALEFAVTLVNSSPTDKTVDVALEIDGAGVVRKIRKSLRAAGLEGSSGTVRFHHRFTQPGQVSGKVFLDCTDDLSLDNVWRFCLTVSGRIRALVVQGPPDEADVPGLEPGTMLALALAPYEDAAAPWPIRPRVQRIGEFGPDDLEATDIAFFCDVPQFTPEQARAIERFAGAGGTAAFFLGPRVETENYNDLFVQQVPAEGGVLPGRLLPAVGEIGPTAESHRVAKVAIDHEYLAGLFENHADYLTVLVQRYYRLALSAQPGKTLIALASGDPVIQLKDFGRGRVVLCTTTASPKWSNLPITGLFLPMAARMSLLARRTMRQDEMYLPGAAVTIRPEMIGSGRPADEKAYVTVTPPSPDGQPAAALPPIELAGTPEGPQAVFKATDDLGLYRWHISRSGGAQGASGAFVVNPFGPECRLDAMPARAFQGAMKARGMERVYVAGTLAEVHALAAAQSQGRNWWDLILSVAIVVLVFEAVVANRRTRDDVVPEHLVPLTAR